LYTQVNAALLSDSAESINRFIPFIRILNLYITPKKLMAKKVLYRAGAPTKAQPTRDIVRQPIYVSLSEDIDVVAQNLQPGTPCFFFSLFPSPFFFPFLLFLSSPLPLSLCLN
jgi:hypothetical protein